MSTEHKLSRCWVVTRAREDQNTEIQNWAWQRVTLLLKQASVTCHARTARLTRGWSSQLGGLHWQQAAQRFSWFVWTWRNAFLSRVLMRKASVPLQDRRNILTGDKDFAHLTRSQLLSIWTWCWRLNVSITVIHLPYVSSISQLARGPITSEHDCDEIQDRRPQCKASPDVLECKCLKVL